MYDYLLPNGSVVLLKEAERKLMIIGRLVLGNEDDTIYDYAGVLHPDGLLMGDEMYFFMHEDIDKIYFMGCQDEEELAYHRDFLEELGELEVVDGEIVEKED